MPSRHKSNIKGHQSAAVRVGACIKNVVFCCVRLWLFCSFTGCVTVWVWQLYQNLLKTITFIFIFIFFPLPGPLRSSWNCHHWSVVKESMCSRAQRRSSWAVQDPESSTAPNTEGSHSAWHTQNKHFGYAPTPHVLWFLYIHRFCLFLCVLCRCTFVIFFVVVL